MSREFTSLDVALAVGFGALIGAAFVALVVERAEKWLRQRRSRRNGGAAL